MRFARVNLRLPEWVEEYVPDEETLYPTAEDRMRLVIGLARENLRRGTGGPFGAAIFEKESWRLVSAGVNVVVPQSNSAAHAEMVAIMVAQAGLGDFDLGGEGCPAYELVTSTEPCAMCFGAVPWSGVRTIVCGARDEDARGSGFDEGAKIADWATELEERGISVQRDVLREESAEVLREYAESGGVIYNGRRGE
jgi:tRNA(Arg) A34 adenosine deaminase TadA